VKNKVLISVAVILAVLSVGALTGILLAGQGEQVVAAETQSESKEENLLVVSGVGRVSLKPDIAYINAGVETIMKDAREAQQENAKIMNRVIAALKASGVQDKDIQTANYNVFIEYDYSEQQRRLIGYRVSNNVRVAIRQIDRVGEILTELAEAGANQFHGITFGVEDQSDAYAEALEKAIAEAKTEAGIMAKAAGVQLGKPQSIHEGHAPVGIPFAQDLGMVRMEAAFQAPIMEGQLEVQATVTIVYEIK